MARLLLEIWIQAKQRPCHGMAAGLRAVDRVFRKARQRRMVLRG
jgi:hypothetical protein